MLWMEEKVANRIHLWLDKIKNFDVYREVDLGSGGRIDIVAHTPEGEWIGYEAKSLVGPLRDQDQLNNYLESGFFDKLYVAGSHVDFFCKAMNREDWHHLSAFMIPCYKAANTGNRLVSKYENSIEDIQQAIMQENEEVLNIRLYDGRKFLEWVKKPPNITNEWSSINEMEIIDDFSVSGVAKAVNNALAWSINIEKIGVIEVSLAPKVSENKSIDEELTYYHSSSIERKPTIKMKASNLERSKELSPQPSEKELQYILWREMDGLAEGAIASTKDVGNLSLNMDLISFGDCLHPTEALKSNGCIHGIEIKTREGLSDTQRLKNQIIKYTENEMLSHFSIAVPSDSTDSVRKFLDSSEISIRDKVGIIGVNSHGSIKFHRDPKSLSFSYDAFTVEGWDGVIFVGYEEFTILEDSVEPESVLVLCPDT